jgi:pimeloyl-ACP methyl ester carboxylesterase
MATFVLVHGAWHGGWCWRRVRSLLQEQGHIVFTPTLTGLCERSHLFSGSINLTTHVTDVVNLIEWEGLEDIVLCGHSYGGMVITGVAERVPERIRSLVFLDAFVPADGQSLMSFSTPDAVARRMEGAAALGGIAIPPTPAAVFNVNAADRDWVDRQCTPQPLGTFNEPVRVTGRSASIFAKGWGPGPFHRFYEALKDDPGWVVETLASGHDTMLDMPVETAALLVSSADIPPGPS